MSDRWNPRWLVPAVGMAIVAPLLAAAIAQRDAHWHPVYDLAMTELRVRDVGGRHTPLIGLQGRIGPTGSHPGPLSFYLLAPVYRIFGSSAFSLQLASAAFHAAAGVSAVLVASRWRDGRVVLGVGIGVLLLVQGYGLGPLTEPWNPHLPVLWFFAFLVAVWAVVAGDLPMLVPAVFAASVCAQTHVPYLPMALGVGALAVAATVWWWRRGEADGLRWLLIAGAVGLVLWAPPLVDELVHDPGNLSQIVDHLGSPQEDPIGLRTAGRFVRERLDGWQLVVGETQHPGTYARPFSGPGPLPERGAVAIVLWAVAVVVAVRLRHRTLIALDLVTATAAVVAVAAISRIYGVPWPYLMFGVFGVTAMLVLGVGGAVLASIDRVPTLSRRAGPLLGVGGLVAVGLLTLRLLAIAGDASPDVPLQTARLARITAPTAAALERGAGAASGRDGRYLVTWADAAGGGSEGIGLVNELVRRGFDVGVRERDRVQIGAHRVMSRDEATAEVAVVVGGAMEEWRRRGGEQVFFEDPRSAAEQIEFQEARTVAIEALRDEGRDDLVSRVDSDLFGLALNEGLPSSVLDPVTRMLDIGLPIAVFIAPAAVAP